MKDAQTIKHAISKGTYTQATSSFMKCITCAIGTSDHKLLVSVSVLAKILVSVSAQISVSAICVTFGIG
jgi:hypothetical protein